MNETRKQRIAELRRNVCNYCSLSESAYCDSCIDFSEFEGIVTAEIKAMA